MITVGKLAKMFGLSRTALLYYDEIGIFSPSGRGENGYRLYSENDIEKLKQIISLREAGVPLNEIFKCLVASEMEISSLLLKRLDEINQEIENIKKQQDVIIKLLKSSDLKILRTNVNKEIWLGILKNAGINRNTAAKWHNDFEKNSPEQHQKFLLALGMTQDEIQKMRTAEVLSGFPSLL
jgi:MerR family transcriptional regulator, thiopeptide resistance regulator